MRRFPAQSISSKPKPSTLYKLFYLCNDNLKKFHVVYFIVFENNTLLR